MIRILSFLVVVALAVPCVAQGVTDGQVTRSFAQPFVSSLVASSESGVIQSALVVEGQRVKAGDGLAFLNHHVLKKSKQLAEARANSTADVDAAKASLDMLKAQLETAQRLFHKGHVNQYEVDQKVLEYKNAQAQYLSALNQLELERLEVERIEAQIEQRKIKSPIDGFVIEILKQVGEHVSSNEPQYARVVQLSRLRAKFYLKDESLSGITEGAIVYVNVGERKTAKQALVTLVSPIIDPESGTRRVEVAIDNKELKLTSGSVVFWPLDVNLRTVSLPAKNHQR